MSKSRHTEAQMIGALKQVEAGRKAEDVAREVVRYRVCKAGWKREAVKNSESDIDVFGKNQITQEDNRRVAYYH